MRTNKRVLFGYYFHAYTFLIFNTCGRLIESSSSSTCYLSSSPSLLLEMNI
ncbi:hypothetical protein HanIR_Chr04g0207431 [Helianthus annuus]|nr:hypothetical protein HanIR_Chr04g0207431 [Helianthus annuus]